jgi:arginine/ornithine transport system substrate-binding protein
VTFPDADIMTQPPRRLAARRTLRLLGLLATALPLALAAGPGAAQGVLKIGVEGAYPPFSEIGTDGKLKGFDIDIAWALCERMKRSCELVQAEFDAMIPSLRAKKFDAIIASMSITPERKKNVDFSDRYYQTPARFIAKDGSSVDISPEGLKGKKIGVQRTTIHDRFATATFKGATIVRYAKQDEVYLDLKAGRVDVAIQDLVAGDVGFIKTPAGKGFKFVGPLYSDPTFFGDGAGVAVRKGDEALRRAFNDAIAALRADGGYKKIQDKYFDFDIYGETKKK